VFGKEGRPRPTPYILSDEQICQIIQLASQSGYRTLRRQIYSTFFALLACTGLRVSEAIRLKYDDITEDGLVVRSTKFRKSRLVPLHETARGRRTVPEATTSLRPLRQPRLYLTETETIAD
jgi:integrase